MKSNSLTGILLLVYSVFFTSTIHAQSWQWLNYTGGKSSTTAFSLNKDLSSDVHGNTYLLADMSSPAETIYSNDVKLTSIKGGQGSFLLVSNNPDGKYRWSKVIAASTAIAYNVRVSLQGNIFILANILASSTYKGQVDADTTIPLSAAGSNGMTIISYDTNGKFRWMIQPDTNLFASNDFQSMDIDEDGNIYCLVSFLPGTRLAGSPLTIPATVPYKGRAFHVLKYNASGTLQSITMLKDFSSDFHHLGAHAGDGPLLTWNKFCKGYYLTATTVTKNPDSTYVKGKSYPYSVFMGSFSEDGSLKWHRSDTQTYYLGIFAKHLTYTPVQVDEKGDIYWSGTIRNGNSLNGFDLKQYFCTDKNQMVPFVIKMDSTGKLLWGTNAAPKYCYLIDYDAGFSFSKTGKGYGIMAGRGWGRWFAGNPLGDSVIINTSFNPTYGHAGWYASIDLKTGKTLGIGVMQGEKKEWGSRTIVHFNKDVFYIANSSDSRSLLFDSTFSANSKRTIPGNEVFLAKYGLPSGCLKAPAAAFTYKDGTFTFTGTSPNDSVTWDFGDGKSANGTVVFHKYLVKKSYKVCVKLWTKDCGVLVKCQYINNPLNISDISPSGNVPKAYPNPANTYVNIENAKPSSDIIVYNSFGQEMWHGKTQGDNDQINVEQWPAGLYFVQIKDEDGSKQQLSFSKN